MHLCSGTGFSSTTSTKPKVHESTKPQTQQRQLGYNLGSMLYCCHTCQIRVTWFRASGLYIISTVVQFGGAHMNNHAFAAITHTLSILTASSCHKTVVRNMKTLIWMKVVYPHIKPSPNAPPSTCPQPSTQTTKKDQQHPTR